MSRAERISLAQNGVTENLINSKLADVTRKILPEKIKIQLRQVVRGEKARYPLQEPLTVKVGCAEARFWIINHSDWYRIGTQNFEKGYGAKLIEVVEATENPRFADIGSAQGYYSILAAKAGAEVTAFDPDPVSQKSMKNNLAINTDVEQQINSQAVVLCSQEGELTLHIDRSGTYAPSLVRTVRGLKEEIQVPVTTMDLMISGGKIKVPNIVKIDVEGAEGLVLAGMRDTLTSVNKPTHLFIELHRKYLPRFKSSPEEVQKLITDCGYNLNNCWDRRSELLSLQAMLINEVCKLCL